MMMVAKLLSVASLFVTSDALAMTRRSLFQKSAAAVAGSLAFRTAAKADVPLTGAAAPAFSLPSNRGSDISLSSLTGKKWTVLYFYPGDFTEVRFSCRVPRCRGLPCFLCSAQCGLLHSSLDSKSISENEAFLRQL